MPGCPCRLEVATIRIAAAELAAAIRGLGPGVVEMEAVKGRSGKRGRVGAEMPSGEDRVLVSRAE